MSSVNKVILIGNLGRDPEVKYLDNQKVVATFTLATNETFTDRNGERRVETEWHNIELWDNLAKVAERFCKKGAQVFIEGKIRTENWKDKEGNERSGKKIRATALTLLGPKPNEGNHGHHANHSHVNHTASAPVPAPAAAPVTLGAPTDDLPF